MRNTLCEGYTRGDKIAKDRWPSSYKKYKIANLWRHDLLDGKRLFYTILGKADGLILVITEVFTSHAKYDKRFELLERVS